MKVIFKIIIIVALILSATHVSATSFLGITFVSNTEIEIGENVTFFSHVWNFTTQPLLGAQNNLTIFMPNRSVYAYAIMSEEGNGTYTYSFIAPAVEGVWLAYDNVSFEKNYTVAITSFHVIPWAGYSQHIQTSSSNIQGTSTTIGNDVKKLPVLDGLNNALNVIKNLIASYDKNLIIILAFLFLIITIILAVIAQLKGHEKKRGYL